MVEETESDLPTDRHCLILLVQLRRFCFLFVFLVSFCFVHTAQSYRRAIFLCLINSKPLGLLHRLLSSSRNKQTNSRTTKLYCLLCFSLLCFVSFRLACQSTILTLTTTFTVLLLLLLLLLPVLLLSFHRSIPSNIPFDKP